MSLDYIESFRAAMLDNGIDYSGEIIPDGRLRRIKCDGDRGSVKRGWYLLHGDGLPAGTFGHYKLMGGTSGINWHAEKPDRTSPAERAELRRQMRENQERREQAEAKRQAAAAELAVSMWKQARPAPLDHPYLARKRINPNGVRVGTWRRKDVDYPNVLLVPLILDGKIVNLQGIFPGKVIDGERDKDFLPGGRKKGCYFPLGKPSEDSTPVIIAEGFATGASVHQATGHLTVCAFDAGNMVDVARAMRGKFPRAEIILAADNDQWTIPDRGAANPGLTKAREAAAVAGGRVVCPSVPSDDPDRRTDWNDIHVSEGIVAVTTAFLPPDELRPVGDDHFDEAPPYEPPEYIPPPPDDDQDDDLPFQVLGVDKGRYYYLPHGCQQIVELTASQHTALNFVALAPLSWWARRYPAKSGFDSAEAANFLMRACEARGIYDPMRVRGRGAWWDDGRVVLHLGDRVVVEGESTPVARFRSRYIYEAAAPMRSNTEAPLPVREAHKLVEVLERLSWEKPINAKLLAGWIALAPICGALAWRPHAWLTGGAGTGKSWIVNNIIRPMLGDTALHVESVTTEAGIRQSLDTAALPVIFDETEAKDTAAQNRLQQVLFLIRQASSDGGAILKGSASGNSKAFRIRSMFMLSSIGVSAVDHADQTRISVLGLEHRRGVDPDEARRVFQTEIEPAVRDLITEEYAARFHARSIRNIAVIRQNAKIFASSAASALGTQRLGDQVGALLAGAFSLHSDAVITPERAAQWIASQTWEDERADEAGDEFACMSRIAEHIVRLPMCERSIGELIEIASGLRNDSAILAGEAEATLLRSGFRVVRDGVTVANNHTFLRKILEGTPWAAGWNRILKRLPDAHPSAQARFGPGAPQRGVTIPLRHITDRASPERNF